MIEDSELLRRYAEEGSESAFAELVQRHLSLVYGCALRRTGGDAHLAEDVAQQVFTIAARRASQLARRPVLAGWLFTSARYAAAAATRNARRRARREQEAHTMQHDSQNPEATHNWEQTRPALDEAIAELGERDREAILLRFFEGRDFPSIGAKLSLSGNTARMRVERALEKLRARLQHRGITSTAAALAAALANQTAFAMPAGLASSVTGAALSGAAAGGTGATVLVFLVMNKIKIGVAVVLAAAFVATAIRDVQASRAWGAEIASLQRVPGEIVALRAANERLASALTASSEQDPEATELAQLRTRIGQLQAPAPESVNGPSMRAVTSFGNAGWATPSAAYETLIWAIATRNLEAFAEAHRQSPAGKTKLDRFFAGLSADVRTRHGTTAKWIASKASGWTQTEKPIAVQMIDEAAGPSMTANGPDMTVRGRERFASGREANRDVIFQRFDDGWGILITDRMVDAIVASFNPATGEPPARK